MPHLDRHRHVLESLGETMRDRVPGGEHSRVGRRMRVVVQDPLIGLLEEHRVADQVGELLEYFGHPGPIEDQFGEPPVGLLCMLERERLLADDLAVKGDSVTSTNGTSR